MEKYFKITANFEKVRNLVQSGEGEFILQEKIDGSQIRGEITPEGEIHTGSKDVEWDEVTVVDKQFTLGKEKMTEALLKLKPIRKHVVLFGEYLSKERHNSIHYDRVPKNNIYLFDAKIDGKWLTEPQLSGLAVMLDLEPPNTLAIMDSMPDMTIIRGYLEQPSILGGQREGVVVKNRDILFEKFTVEQFFAMKVVNDKFKELNKEVWETEKRAGIRSIEDLVQTVISAIQLQAFWNKSIQHLRDSGESEHSMRDIPKLIELLQKDIEEELADEFKEQLYKHMKTNI